jgi:hypothetical protein
MNRKWVKVDNYHIKSDNYTISKTGGTGFTYCLWNNGKMVKWSNDLNELKEMAK